MPSRLKRPRKSFNIQSSPFFKRQRAKHDPLFVSEKDLRESAAVRAYIARQQLARQSSTGVSNPSASVASLFSSRDTSSVRPSKSRKVGDKKAFSARVSRLENLLLPSRKRAPPRNPNRVVVPPDFFQSPLPRSRIVPVRPGPRRRRIQETKSDIPDRIDTGIHEQVPYQQYDPDLPPDPPGPPMSDIEMANVEPEANPWLEYQPEFGYRKVTQRASRAAMRKAYGYNMYYATPTQRLARQRDSYYGRGPFRSRRRRRKRVSYRYTRPYKRRRRIPRGLYTGTVTHGGRGSFFGDIGKALKSPFMHRLGGFANAELDRLSPFLGRIMRWGRKATGMGAYQAGGSARYTKSNALVNSGSGIAGDILRFTPQQDSGQMVVSHTEFCGNIYAPESSSIDHTTFDLNPGLESTFTWLSGIANNFNYYEFIQLAFTYTSTVTDFTTTTGQAGSVLFCAQYSPQEEPPVTEAEILNIDGSATIKTTDSCAVGIECDPKLLPGEGVTKMQKSIRSGGIKANRDIINYDWGRFQLSVSNCPPVLFNQQIGRLFVSYTVRLVSPDLNQVTGQSITRTTYGNAALPLTGVAGAITARMCTNVSTGTGVQYCFDLRSPALLRANQNSIPLNFTYGSGGFVMNSYRLPWAQGNTAAMPAVGEDATYWLARVDTPGFDYVTNHRASGPVVPTIIELPAQLSGKFALTFTLSVSVVTVGRIYVGCPAKVGDPGLVDQIVPGQIKPIRDMLTAFKYSNDPDIPSAAGGVDCNDRFSCWEGGMQEPADLSVGGGSPFVAKNTNMTVTVHIEVQPVIQAAAGEVIPNQLYIVFDSTCAAGFGQIQNATITLSDYNQFNTNINDPRPEFHYVSNGAQWNPTDQGI